MDKSRFVTYLARVLIASGLVGMVYNYTGDDIVLLDGSEIKTENLKEHLTSKYIDREVDTVTIYLHHTVTSREASIESINKIHTDRGWQKVSYHIATNYEGKLFFLNPLTKYTYHTKGKNKKGISIVLIGNYEEYYPSKEMITMTRFIIEQLCNTPNLYIEGIKGHKDVKATLCPGKYAYTEFKDLFY